ncbi:indole-3-glycerol phosphate synthase TrpC [Clostridium sp. LY3-2]|uniref:indole-3-glycerol phosphate synthase TrpC n=1 Tax=Clostridium sp. LY3-2 TaxID=2942482 RepID=UPI0021530B42|nr:indole-3-glycerol phosphate synthase TrpC [Clostridium sp. LY3-2]MCR6513332.1 indole-3-glycerol phosphate synthase TrpC [Clostridium sp. LY3-2]
MYLEKISFVKLEKINSLKENKELFKKALLKEDLTIIGELKKASPSKGEIVKDFNLEKINEFHKKENIDAYSILTEEEFFKGKDEYISLIKGISDKPILRKDFIIDKYQIYESKFLGADCILLIVALLKDKLKEFYELGKELGLDILVEVHSKEELDLALKINPEIIGINNRNLKNFKVDLENTKELIKYIPKGILTISESGINSFEDIDYIKSLGVDGVLVGEFFMRRFINENKDLWN